MPQVPRSAPPRSHRRDPHRHRPHRHRPLRHPRPVAAAGASSGGRASGSAGSSCWCCSGSSTSSPCRSTPGTRSTRSTWEPSGTRPDDQPGTTYLLVGSDSRAGLSAGASASSSAPATPTGQRTDTIMLLHTGSGPNLLMSIPRDSLVEIPGHGTTKINAAYAYGGAKLLVQDHRERHRHPGRRLRRDRPRRSRRRGRRGRRHRDLPDQRHEGQAGQPRHQEGLPGGRRRDRARLRPLAAHLEHRRHRPGQAPARGRLGGRSSKVRLAVDLPQPVPLLEPAHRGAGLLRLRRGHRPGAGRPVGLGDDPRERRRRPQLRGPDLRPRRALGPDAVASRCSTTSSRTRPPTSPRACARRRGCRRASPGDRHDGELRDPRLVGRRGRHRHPHAEPPRRAQRLRPDDGPRAGAGLPHRRRATTRSARSWSPAPAAPSAPGMDLSAEGNVFGLDESVRPTPEELRDAPRPRRRTTTASATPAAG